MSIKFVNLLSKYLPSHFKIAPKDVELYLDETLELTPTTRTRHLLSTLDPTSTEIEYDYGDNLNLFKDRGIVKIENEYIKYETNDLVNHKLTNLERGFLGTEATAHCNTVLWNALLAEDLDAYTTTVKFTSVTNIDVIPKQGKFAIFSDAGDLEEISYTSYSQWLNGYQFEGVTRGGGGTSAVKHAQGSYIQEYENLLITQLDTVKYDNGLWTATLATALTATSTEIVINQKFLARLASSTVVNDKIIFLQGITGTVPKNGYILIDNEIIRYGNFIVDSATPDSGRLEECTRGSQGTRAASHVVDIVNSYYPYVYCTFPNNGEFLIEDEYIQYTDYDEVTRTFSGLYRGLYGSTADTHAVGVAMTERRHTELESTGFFRIGNEYFKYWYLDEDFFYIDSRPALVSKTAYHITGSNVTSIIEGHDTGSIITTYHFEDENSYLIDFIHSVAEHLDLAINTKINQFENFSDADKVNADYLQYIVNQLGENLEDYQNLPFFTVSSRTRNVTATTGDYWTATTDHKLNNGDSIVFSGRGGGVNPNKHYIVANRTNIKFQIEEITTGEIVPLTLGESNTIVGNDYRVRLFTKELVNIYKEKGLISALKLWHLVISEPLTSYQDLWTFNYCSFYSLPFLVLILYESLRTFYPNNENFFRPQISKALQEELAEFYENKEIDTHAVPDLKLLIYDWEYFRKTDDDVKSSDGGSFDDKVVPCDSLDDLDIFYDTTNVELQVRSTGDTIPLPFYVEDYDVDLFKFEEQLDAEKDTMPTESTDCSPTKTDEGLISDIPFEWITDIDTESIFDYCTVADRLQPLRTDLEVLRDLTSDQGNARLILDHNTSSSDTEILVKVLEGKLYDPADHIVLGTNPRIVPKGFVKFGDEVISYTGVEFYDNHTGTFTNKKYLLTGCNRGVNGTTAADYRINLYQYEDNERLLNNCYVRVIYLPQVIDCDVDIPTDTLTHINHGLETNDIILFAPDVNGGGITGTKTTDAVPYYYYVYQLDSDRFQISLTPITTSVTPVDITSNTRVICYKIYFQLVLTRDPQGYGVQVGDYLQLVQTAYDYRHLITGVVNTYDHCAETYTYGINFVTGINPIPAVLTEVGAGLPSISSSTEYDCEINKSTFQISYVDTSTTPYTTLTHDLSDGDTVFFLKSVGNIDAYENYYVKCPTPTAFELTQSMTPWGKIVLAGVNDTWSCATAHGLNDGDLIVFEDSGPLAGGVSAGQHYLVSSVGLTGLTFKIRSVSTGEIVPLIVPGGNTISYSSIAITNIKDPINTYMVSGTRVLSVEEGYQHRYSLIQHLLWRLDNEVNGNDLPLVYGLTTTELAAKKLDTYTGVKDGIIWPTPHFKYGFEISTEDITNFPPDEVVELVLKKLKQYKPKHTVADLTITYPLGGNQVGITPMMEYYETENLMSDAYRTFSATITNLSTIITATNPTYHDLHVGETVYIEFGSPTVFGTVYYVESVPSETTFTISATDGGAPITMTITGTVAITQAPPSEFRIDLDHNTADGIIDKTYNLPIITLDSVYDYGQFASFFYTWREGYPNQTLIYYAPFSAYPNGLTTDTYRNRKRFLSYVD